MYKNMKMRSWGWVQPGHWARQVRLRILSINFNTTTSTTRSSERTLYPRSQLTRRLFIVSNRINLASELHWTQFPQIHALLYQKPCYLSPSTSPPIRHQTHCPLTTSNTRKPWRHNRTGRNKSNRGTEVDHIRRQDLDVWCGYQTPL